MSNRVRPGRRKKELIHDGGPVTAFALALRQLREQAGNPTYRQMAQKSHVAPNLLSQADSGHRLPTEAALTAYVTACGGNVEEWKERLRKARAAQAALQHDSTGPAKDNGVDHTPAQARSTNETKSDQPHTATRTRPEDATTAMGTPSAPPTPRRSRWRPKLAVLSLATVVAVVTSVFFIVTGTTGGGSSEPQASADAGRPESTLDAQCRSSWEKIRRASIYVIPCIEVQADELLISVQVRPANDSGIVDATVWVWPMHLDAQLLERKQYDLVREPSTLRSCRLTFTHDEVQTCGPFAVTPTTGPGFYNAATSADIHEAQYPPGWNSSLFAGTQSPKVDFRAPEQGASRD